MSQGIAVQTRLPRSVTPALVFMLALACALIVANLYYAQPLTGLIGAALGLAPAQTGLLVTMTQLGYGLGLMLFVPLGDLIENRKLAVVSIAVAMIGLVAMAFAHSAGVFLAATLIARPRLSPVCKSCCHSRRISPATRIAAG